jgi:hypothetical protein
MEAGTSCRTILKWLKPVGAPTWVLILQSTIVRMETWLIGPMHACEMLRTTLAFKSIQSQTILLHSRTSHSICFQTLIELARINKTLFPEIFITTYHVCMSRKSRHWLLLHMSSWTRFVIRPSYRGWYGFTCPRHASQPKKWVVVQFAAPHRKHSHSTNVLAYC